LPSPQRLLLLLPLHFLFVIPEGDLLLLLSLPLPLLFGCHPVGICFLLLPNPQIHLQLTNGKTHEG
jgi:hypothetical protein